MKNSLKQKVKGFLGLFFGIMIFAAFQIQAAVLSPKINKSNKYVDRQCKCRNDDRCF